MKHINVRDIYLQDAITNQEVWLRKVCTKQNVADHLTKSAKLHLLGNTLRSLTLELLDTTCKVVSMNLIVVKNIKNELMGEQNSTPGARGVNPSTGCTNIVTDCRDIWHKNVVTDCREKWHKNVETDCRENVEIDAESPGRQSKCWAQERRDGATRVEEHHDGTTKCEKETSFCSLFL